MPMRCKIIFYAQFTIIPALAEGEGFEPSKCFKHLHAFQACAFNHSATPPYDAQPIQLSVTMNDTGITRSGLNVLFY